MAAVWQVQEAKNRLSELMDRAITEGPQVITRHGKPVVKVVAADGSDVESTRSESDEEFLRFLFSAPKLPEGLPAMPRRNRHKSPFGDEA